MKLYYRTVGEGRPFIMVHGLWGASENWLPVAHLLEQKSVKLDKSVLGTLVFSEDSVDWESFSTKESDVEICMRENAMEVETHLPIMDSRDRRAKGKGMRV